MLLSEYIENLKSVLEENGDLKVVYAVDDEGNAFNEVCFAPSVGHYDYSDSQFTTYDNFGEDEDIDYEINSVCIN